jgi:hypothetical protein
VFSITNVSPTLAWIASGGNIMSLIVTFMSAAVAVPAASTSAPASNSRMVSPLAAWTGHQQTPCGRAPFIAPRGFTPK